MSDEKIEKKVESGGPVPEKKNEKKRSAGIFSYVAIIVACLLVLAVISVFLNNQKLHKQIVELDRKVATLQEGDKELGNRVLILEDELVVLSLKGRLAKVRNSVKDLLNLQGLMSENQKLVSTVQGLVDELGGEEKKLEQEIAGTAPKVFQPSRSCRQSCYQSCPEQVVIMHPPIPQPKAVPTGLAKAAEAHTAAHGGHAAPKTGTSAPTENPGTWWSKFIRLRLFGN